jgi:hypothetical protein
MPRVCIILSYMMITWCWSHDDPQNIINLNGKYIILRQKIMLHFRSKNFYHPYIHNHHGEILDHSHSMNNLLIEKDLLKSSYPKKMLVVSVGEETLINLLVEGTTQHLTRRTNVTTLPAHTRANMLRLHLNYIIRTPKKHTSDFIIWNIPIYKQH